MSELNNTSESETQKFSDLIDLLRARCMYGDDYAEGKAHPFDRESWRGSCVLISAYHHVVNGIQYYGRSTAQIALGIASEECHAARD